MRCILAIAIGCMTFAPVFAETVPVSITTFSADDLKENAKREAKREKVVRTFCRRARAAHGRMEKLLPLKDDEWDRAFEFVDDLERGKANCPKDPDLAIALMDSLVANSSPFHIDDSWINRLARMLLNRGRPEDLVRAEELVRIMWVRNINYLYPTALAPHWTEAERTAFIARDDVWAYLQAQAVRYPQTNDKLIEAWLDPQSPRFDPVKGIAQLEAHSSVFDWVRAANLLLEGRLVPADPARAETLLWKAAQFDDNARLVLLDVLQPRLTSKDPGVRAPLLKRFLPWFQTGTPLSEPLRERLTKVYLLELDAPDALQQRDAAQLLTAIATQGTASAVPPLLRWINNVLRARNDPRQNAARTMLARLITANIAPARTMLDQEFARHGGLIEAGAWTPDPARPVGFDKYITSNDYPTRALREEREGIVQAWAVIGPDGRVVLVEVEPSGSPDLDQMVRGIVQRRFRRTFTEYPGRYVRIKLLPIQFRIQHCDKDEPVTKPVEGAALVDGLSCFQTLIQETPVV